MKKMPLSIFLRGRNDSPDADVVAPSPHAITVGAMKTMDTPDLGAPPNDVVSLLADIAASTQSPGVFCDAATGNAYIHPETAVWGTTAA